MLQVSGLLLLLAALTTVSANPAETNDQLLRKRASHPPVKSRGNAFWIGDERFYIRGIDYQPGGSSAKIDPLANPKICLRDVKQFEKLGLNAIRVYTVDNSKNHDECMEALHNAGIYLILDVNNPDYSINRDDPHPSYNAKYLQSVFATVEMFARYENTLAFFSGNEVINDKNGTDRAAPYVKAVTRDIRNFIRSQGLRAIPVGYSAADVDFNRMQMAMYMNCGSDDMRSDFFAFNDYSWCGSDFKTSGWGQKVQNFTDYGLPIFLSEWGCIDNRPRNFKEISALMSTDMSSVYSGGLMYEYSTEKNKFGIVELDGEKETVVTSDEFQLFKEAMSKYPTPTGAGGAASTTHAVQCPTSDSTWNVDPSLVPLMPEQAEKYMKHGAGSGPGLGGGGSQNAVDSGTAVTSVTSGQASPVAPGKESKEDSAASVGHWDRTAVAVTGLTLLFCLFEAFDVV